jgi:enamine deaminase RidA (YjgF/YER057c/UK114 family)
MRNKLDIIHTVPLEEIDNNPHWKMPYVPAIKVLSGKPLYISGVNAASIYHSHPHQSTEFDHMDFSPESQAKLTMENLQSILTAAGSSFNDIVQLLIFIVDAQKNGDRIGKIISSYMNNHRCTSTVVGITDLITDSRLILEITATAYVD